VTIGVALDEDHHVHSTFSDDAVSTVAENVGAARRRGLRTLCLADHVRRDSAWVPDFLSAVEALRPAAGLVLLAGVEAKILDRTGQLDLPENATGVDRVLIADHQFPADLGPVHPARMRQALADRLVTPGEVIECLVDAIAGALLLVASPPMTGKPQLAHLFSILPKVGLAESDVPGQAVSHLARQARAAGARLEVNEKWACPSARTVRAFAEAGVPLVASTDSHDCRDVGVYASVRQIVDSARGGAAVGAGLGGTTPPDPPANGTRPLWPTPCWRSRRRSSRWWWSGPCRCSWPTTSSCWPRATSAACTTASASPGFPGWRSSSRRGTSTRSSARRSTG
jgi:putative hydrolase